MTDPIRTTLSADEAPSVAARFWPKVDQAGECWLWTGGRNAKGYGVIQVLGVNHPAHRVAVMLSGETIPEGMVVDHLCRVRACVRRSHLEVVTSRENTMRGQTIPAANLAKTLCPRGHEYSHRADGARYCRACGSARNRGYYARNREALQQRARDRYWSGRSEASMEAGR